MNRRRLFLDGGAALLALAAVAAPARNEPAWQRFDACVLVTNAYGDGDSFHVRIPAGTGRDANKTEEKIFRLCFVDTPETDLFVPDRVRDQAAYWGVSTNRVLRLGEAARRFTRDLLKDGFTVYTRFRDAKGHSRQPRYFAMIRVGGRWLSAALVENGLARIYGYRPNLPDGTSWKEYEATLKRLEARARRLRRGGFAPESDADTPAKPADDGRRIVLSQPLAVYSLETPPRLLGVLPPGRRIVLLNCESPFRLRIRYEVNGQPREGQCYRTQLGRIPPPDTPSTRR